jgi:hypothetical protein
MNEQDLKNPDTIWRKLRDCFFISLVLFLGVYICDTQILHPRKSNATVAKQFRVTPPITSPYKHTRIADIQVGERVVTSSDDTPKPTAVDSLTWKKVTLYAEDIWYDGTIDKINVITLVPPEWISLYDVQIGSMVPIPLDVQEMGFNDDNLFAKILAIEQCPEIRAGPGRVVLTTVNHLSRGVCSLTYINSAGQNETIRPTASHRFYSLDRKGWIHIGDANKGEQLQGFNNDIITVLSCQPLGKTERVYNMTVEDEHVYHVGKLNLLTHNNCPISIKNFHRINNSRQGQNMNSYERRFVETIRSRKPNLQIHRTDDGTGLGDFLLVDFTNNPSQKSYLVELKSHPNSPHAGYQLRNFKYVNQVMTEIPQPEPMTGTIEEIMDRIINTSNH